MSESISGTELIRQELDRKKQEYREYLLKEVEQVFSASVAQAMRHALNVEAERTMQNFEVLKGQVNILFEKK